MTSTTQGGDGFAAAVIRDLCNAYDLDGGFELCVVLGDSPSTLRYVYQALDQHAGSRGAIRRVEPNGDIVRSLGAVAQTLALLDSVGVGEGPRPIVWLEQQLFDAQAWRDALSRLNQQRSWLIQTVPYFIVLAGPRTLGELAPMNAADLWSVRALVRFVVGVPKPLYQRRHVRWLQLSDLQCRHRLDWQGLAALEALAQWLHGVTARGEGPDLVFVTGDIAYSGKRSEYDQAERYLDRLATAMDREPRTSWFVVPGNHDVDRDSVRSIDQRLLRSVTDADSLAQLQRDAASMEIIGHRLLAFYQFTERFLGPVRAYRPAAPWRGDVVDLNDLAVGVAQLNSAWASGVEHDSGHLLLGEVQIQDCMYFLHQTRVQFALMHHTLADLASYDHERVQHDMDSSKGGPVLLHSPRHDILDGESPTSSSMPLTVRIGQLDVHTGIGRQETLLFRDQEQRWISSSQDSDPDNTFVLPLLGSEQRVPANKSMPHLLRRRIAARYREAALAFYGGQSAVDRPSTPRDKERFLSFELAPWPADATESAEEWARQRISVLELGYQLRPQPDKPAGRFVVLGRSESDQRILCRNLIFLFAQGVEHFRATRDVLPLLVDMGAYAEATQQTAELSLLDFLLGEIRHVLAVPISRDMLQACLEDGQVVVLLHGLHAVTSAERRESIWDRVQAFAHRFVDVPMLLTNLVVGHEDASLNPTSSFRFVSLWLKVPTTKNDTADGFRLPQRRFDLVSPNSASNSARTLSFTLHLTRAISTSDPYTRQLGRQVYICRSSDGVPNTVELDWDDALLSELDDLSTSGSTHASAERLGYRLRALIGTAWRYIERAIIDAAMPGRMQPVHLTILSDAAELHDLPWELLPLETGQHLLELPNVWIRYAWPGARRTPGPPWPQHDDARILLAWSDSHGPVPDGEYRQILRGLNTHARSPSAKQSGIYEELPKVSLTHLRMSLGASVAGAPIWALHLLCRGVHDGDNAGLGLYEPMLHGDQNVASQGVVTGRQLLKCLAPYADHLRLVVLTICGGDERLSSPHRFGHIAQWLHRGGIETVVATRSAISVPDAIYFARAFYAELLRGPTPVERAFQRTRSAVMNPALRYSLQYYAQPPA